MSTLLSSLTCALWITVLKVGRPKSQSILVTLYRRSKPKKLSYRQPQSHSGHWSTRNPWIISSMQIWGIRIPDVVKFTVLRSRTSPLHRRDLNSAWRNPPTACTPNFTTLLQRSPFLSDRPKPNIKPLSKHNVGVHCMSKMQIWPIGLPYLPFLPIRTKFGQREWIYGAMFHAILTILMYK